MTGLGRDFNRLWGAAAVSNLADGLLAAAAPLLVASVTDDPVLVGLAVFVQQLPWLLLSLVSGVLVDRLDRRRLIVVVNAVRAALIGGLALAVLAGEGEPAVVLPAVYAAGFLLGTCETLADTAWNSLVPSVVASEDLPRANARMQGVYFVINRFAAPPLGAALFVGAAALPFGVNAATYALTAFLMAALRRTPGPASAPGPAPAPAHAGTPQRRSVRSDIAEGVRWLWHHPALRMLTLTLCLMNITLMSAISILVLYGRERLGLGALGYGAFLTAIAVGGLAGAVCAPRLQGWFGAPVLLRVGLVIETLTHVGLGLATTAWVAGAVFVAFGIHGGVWGGVERTLRQRVVPDELRGRVESVFMFFAMGGSALGSLLGGPIAAWLGVTGPFWVSAAVMAALTFVAWRPFGRAVAAPPAPVAPSARGQGTLDPAHDHT
ncbi:MFS transporter [Streptomyces sp. 6N223]|uniref:MFS transporter n=1 Tax=Streptomyces sp. 6N223 TaxID=3457412 RepID=UPI003FD5E917